MSHRPAAGPGPPAELGRPAAAGAGPLRPAVVRRAHLVRDQGDEPVQQALRGADHLPRRADRRRLGQRRDGPAAHAGVDRPRPGHHHLHQLARRVVHLDDGDLRHDAVRPAGIQTVCIGQAASAAAVLLAAGTKGKRVALPNARILIHQPATEGGYGQSSDLEIQAREILRMRTAMETIIATAHRPGRGAGPPGHRAGQVLHRGGGEGLRPRGRGSDEPQAPGRGRVVLSEAELIRLRRRPPRRRHMTSRPGAAKRVPSGTDNRLDRQGLAGP